MAEALAKSFSNKDKNELSEKIKKVPEFIRGKVAEQLGNIFDKKSGEKILETDKLSPPKNVESFQGAVDYRVLAITCHNFALESYKKQGEVEGMKRIGDAYVARGNYEKAISIYKDVQSIDPKLLDIERNCVLLFMESEVMNKK